MKTKQFAVWDESDVDENDPDSQGYWSLFDTLEDAVSTYGDGVEVYTANFRKAGTFVRKVEMVKVKSTNKAG